MVRYKRDTSQLSQGNDLLSLSRGRTPTLQIERPNLKLREPQQHSRGVRLSLGENPPPSRKASLHSREDQSHSDMRFEMKLKSKRILLVYKKDEKFYIDHGAAYALGLINTRAMMLDKPHLIEINLETLYRFQNDSDIEIEYQELDKEKQASSREDTRKDSTTALKKRQMLLDACKGAKSSDLREAKGILKEGIEAEKIQGKGQEIYEGRN